MNKHQTYFFNSSLFREIMGVNHIDNNKIQEVSDLEFQYIVEQPKYAIYSGKMVTEESVKELPDSKFKQEIEFQMNIGDDKDCTNVGSIVHVSRSHTGKDYEDELIMDKFINLPHSDIEYVFNIYEVFARLSSGNILHYNNINNKIEIYSSKMVLKVETTIDELDVSLADYQEIKDLLVQRSYTII